MKQVYSYNYWEIKEIFNNMWLESVFYIKNSLFI